MSMQEHYVSGARVAASAGWAVTIALIAAAWVFLFLGGKAAEIGEMLALTAGVSAVAAGVMQVRVYAVKLCAEIRGNARQPTNDDRVRAIH